MDMKQNLEILSSIMLHSMIRNPQQWFDIAEVILTKNFGEDVCYFFWRCTEEYNNGTIMHKLSNVVHMDLNVFGSLLLNWIIADLNSTLIIILDSIWVFLFESTLSK